MSTLAKVWRISELRQKILTTLGLLAVYRVGIFISTPGVDASALKAFFSQNQGGLFGIANGLFGGGLEQASIFALGIMPYISASIIMQLMGVVLPQVEQLQKEGEAGRRKINQYTRYGTILLATFQGYGIARILASGTFGQAVEKPDAFFYFMTVLTLVAGTTFVMWLGEQITEHGLGNGTSLIIFAGIIAQMPQVVTNIGAQLNAGQLGPLNLLIFLGVVAALIGAIVFIELAYRRVPVQYAKRRSAGQGGSLQYTPSYLPIKLNITGVMPPIFAQAMLSFPVTLQGLQLGGIGEFFQRYLSVFQNPWFYNTVFGVLILFFAFFWASIMFKAEDVADNLKKQDGYIPGVRPGRQTAEYLDHVLARITVGGALYLAAVCIAPTVLSQQMNVSQSFLLGGTGLLIVVSVALDTVRQIESKLIDQSYEGFAGRRTPRIRAGTVAG